MMNTKILNGLQENGFINAAPSGQSMSLYWYVLRDLGTKRRFEKNSKDTCKHQQVKNSYKDKENKPNASDVSWLNIVNSESD